MTPVVLATVEFECPLWVISGHRPAYQRCPLCPRKRTCSASKSMSALCHKRSVSLSFIILKLVQMLVGLRISTETEELGIDARVHGERGYNM